MSRNPTRICNTKPWNVSTKHTVRSAVKRSRAESYLLISLTAFAGSVIVTRLFLAPTGYPQICNSVLHIAHALWGALLLVAAVLLLVPVRRRGQPDPRAEV